jgi:hypothetical protein
VRGEGQGAARRPAAQDVSREGRETPSTPGASGRLATQDGANRFTQRISLGQRHARIAQFLPTWFTSVNHFAIHDTRQTLSQP